MLDSSCRPNKGPFMSHPIPPFNSAQSQTICRFAIFPDKWEQSPQFWVGSSIFLLGMTINIHSDSILRKLRTKSTDYQIPTGGMFNYVSSAHYFGEITEWFGYTTACNFALAPVAFATATTGILFGRAINNHRWYKKTFGDRYPRDRRAIIPCII